MADRTGMVGVLVLHRRALADSETWKTLLRQVHADLLQALDFHLLIWDNTPASASAPPLPPWAHYIGAAQNHGIAWPYNYGLERAEARGAAWLLTLDQDTRLPSDYLARLLSKVEALGGQPRLGAIVPQLVSRSGQVYSPWSVSWRGERATALGWEGMAGTNQHPVEVRAFNSAALLRVSALRAVGGYDLRFWLNYLDHALFHALHQAGLRVWVTGDLQLEHHLSLEEDRGRMGEIHFRHFAATESAFRDLHASWPQRVLYTARLVLRLLQQRRRRDPQHFSQVTRKVLLQRLCLSRRERLRRWEQMVAPMLAHPKGVRADLAGETVAAENVTP